MSGNNTAGYSWADAYKDVRSVGTVIGENKASSISKISRDLIFQFPAIITDSVNYDEVYPIIKGIEKNNAALVFAAITAEGVVDRDKYRNVAAFLKSFHNNIDLPVSAIESITPEEDMTTECEMSAVVTEGYMSEHDIACQWECAIEHLDTGLLNDIHKPFLPSAHKMEAAIEAAHTASMEASDDEYYRYLVAKKVNGKVQTDGKGGIIFEVGKDGLPKYEYVAVSPNPRDAEKQTNMYGQAMTLNDWTLSDRSLERRMDRAKLEEQRMHDANVLAQKYAHDKDILAEKREYEQKLRDTEFERGTKDLSRTKTGGQILNDSMFAAMTPTLLTLSLANTGKGSNAWTHTFGIGIKTMPRVVKSPLLVSNMVEAFKNRAIFTFIKWTNKEIKTVDLLFGITESREFVKSGSKWVKILRNRASLSKIPFVGKKLNPITTVIITEAEAIEIKKLTTLDPENPAIAKKMMATHSLLCFCIYDTEEKMVRMMYDGESEFTTVSLRTMISDVNKQLTLDSSRR